MSEHSINDRIELLIKSLGISQRKFAISLDVSPGRITNMLKNRNGPNFQFISKLISVYRNVNANWLLIGEGEMFLSDVKSSVVSEPDRSGWKKPGVIDRVDKIEDAVSHIQAFLKRKYPEDF